MIQNSARFRKFSSLAVVLSITLCLQCWSSNLAFANCTYETQPKQLVIHCDLANDRLIENCEIRFEYPSLDRTSLGAVADSLNALIEKTLTRGMCYPDSCANFEVCAGCYVAEKKAELERADPEMPFWASDRRLCTDSMSIECIIGLQFVIDAGSSSNTRGFWTKQYANVSLTNGKQIVLADLVESDSLPELIRIVRETYRAKKVDGAINAEMAAFEVKESERIQLIDNFLIRDSCLEFYYNSGDSHRALVAGPLVLQLKYSAIRHCLRENGPLGFVRKHFEDAGVDNR